MKQVKQGDTHTIWLTVRDETTGLPVDLSGADVEVWVRKRGSQPVELAVVPVFPYTQGVLAHQLTGTLPPGSYVLVVKLTKDGQQTTAPTNELECFEVTPTIGALA
jgi:hypothetical protein